MIEQWFQCVWARAWRDMSTGTITVAQYFECVRELQRLCKAARVRMLVA